jgi:hypothetical protein
VEVIAAEREVQYYVTEVREGGFLCVFSFIRFVCCVCFVLFLLNAFFFFGRARDIVRMGELEYECIYVSISWIVRFFFSNDIDDAICVAWSNA